MSVDERPILPDLDAPVGRFKEAMRSLRRSTQKAERDMRHLSDQMARQAASRRAYRAHGRSPYTRRRPKTARLRPMGSQPIFAGREDV